MSDSKKLKLPGDSRWLEIVGSLIRAQLFDIINVICKREIAGHHLHPWKGFDECTDYLSILIKGKEKKDYLTLPLTTLKRRITLFGTFAYFDKGERRFIATRSRVSTHLRKDRIDTGARNPLVIYGAELVDFALESKTSRHVTKVN